ncbi:MAG: hypothetical protein QNJ68_24035 [Microcoleaceae cyanobacterium MO_207.B10]|nr:hypothetical protein [Microcoleaceae cyanobacterium MO_207.B10]
MQYRFEVADNFHFLGSNGNLTHILDTRYQKNRIVAQVRVDRSVSTPTSPSEPDVRL